MSLRKPADVPFESWIEQQIRQAQREGLFDALPGAGRAQHLEDAADGLWWVKGLLRREQLDALPPALAIRRSVERTLAALPNLSCEARVRAMLGRLDAEIRTLNARSIGGPPTTQPPLDVEDLVSGWRRARLERDAG